MEDKTGQKDADVSQSEKALGAAKQRSGTALYSTSLSDGILIIDEEGRILDFNKAAHSDLGYTREEFRNQHMDIDPVETRENSRARTETITERRLNSGSHTGPSRRVRNVL